MQTVNVLKERKSSIVLKNAGSGPAAISCDKASVAGSVSQRACVFCGARVVLNPITDAFHIIHGPIGCASYTWDIRGSLTSGSTLFRNSFSTDLRETDIVFGGAAKLRAAIGEVMAQYAPKLIFVYATCIVGVIGDDVEAVCRQAEQTYHNRVIPVKAPGFSGTKSQGYKLACEAILKLISASSGQPKQKGVNILGDFNLSGEIWIIRNYLREIGIPVISTMTGDSSYETLLKAPSVQLNAVQCAGSSVYLAERMQETMRIPYLRVSFFGVEDTSDSLLRIAEALGDEEAIEKARVFTAEKSRETREAIAPYREKLLGKRAAIYVGGGFKAISLIRQFRELGMETVLVGTQTGKPEDYEVIQSLVSPGTVVLDDTNPAELEAFLRGTHAELLVGGVKERPLAYKLGVAFCDHNHERKHALAGYEGAVNFAEEVSQSVNSPVWKAIAAPGF